MNIVTLLPSATDIVCALGHEQSLVGVSHSCQLPASVRELPVMTSTRVPYQDTSETIDTFVRDHLNDNDALYDLDMDALAAAAPDVIVSQALCDVCAVSTGDVLRAIADLPSKPILVDLEPNTFSDVLDDCHRVGKALGCPNQAAVLVASLKARISVVRETTADIAIVDRPRVAFLEWLIPPFNGGHWNPELISLAGGVDLLGVHAQPSSTLDWQTVIDSKPDVLFLACCGLSITRTLEDIDKLESTDHWQRLMEQVQGCVFMVDGMRYFANPGPKLVDALEMMAHALHPERYSTQRLWPITMARWPQISQLCRA